MRYTLFQLGLSQGLGTPWSALGGDAYFDIGVLWGFHTGQQVVFQMSMGTAMRDCIQESVSIATGDTNYITLNHVLLIQKDEDECCIRQ